jgi:hypothetical protein
MRSLGFVLLLVAAAALIKPSGVVGAEVEGWERFLLQWRQHTSLPAPLLNGDLVSHPDTLLFVAFDSIHRFMECLLPLGPGSATNLQYEFLVRSRRLFL